VTTVRLGPSGPETDVGGTELPDGSYVGQPLIWDGSAWGPGGSVAVSSVSSQDGSGGSTIEFPTATPGFGTVARWSIESANLFQVERDNTSFFRRWVLVGETLNPIEAIAPDVGDPLIGFLGATPVVRQSLTGTTEQEQLNSIAAALVALGLAVDNRTP
jgi:hypothetical protein